VFFHQSIEGFGVNGFSFDWCNGFSSDDVPTSFGLENSFDNVSPGALVAGSELVDVAFGVDVVGRHVDSWVDGNENFGGGGGGGG
jgi:hypothetical protein